MTTDIKSYKSFKQNIHNHSGTGEKIIEIIIYSLKASLRGLKTSSRKSKYNRQKCDLKVNQSLVFRFNKSRYYRSVFLLKLALVKGNFS